MDIISRKQAKELGLKKYFTGKPCKRGHVCERRLPNNCCVECNLINGSNHQKNYREQYKERSRTYYYKNLDRCRERSRINGNNNAERYRKATQKWRQDNPDRCKKTAKRWQQFNLDKYREYNAARRALKLQAYPIWADRSEISKIYEECPPGYHVDHDVPLNHPLVCGLHVPANLNHLPAEENLRKSNSFDPETYVHILPEDTQHESHDPRPDSARETADLDRARVAPDRARDAHLGQPG